MWVNYTCGGQASNFVRPLNFGLNEMNVTIFSIRCNLSKAALVIKSKKTIQKSKLEYSDTHREIVESCQRGDRQAQFHLYRLYSKAMYNVALRMLNKVEDAEDILQNSFVDVFTKLHTFQFQSSIGAWIKRIVINNSINHMRKRRMQFEELETRLYAIPCEDPNISIGHSGISVKEVNKALFKLPDGYRVVFSLYLMEGYDHKEIAQILSISEATSKSQYSRAKKKLRDLLTTEQTQSY